jgi:hypothetical protein
MLRTKMTALVSAVGVTGLLLALGAAPAAAHEHRTAGSYRFVVGFGTEPAYAGERNSVQVRISDARGKPVTDLGDGLKVEVTQGGAPAAAGADQQRSLGAAIAQGLIKGLNDKAGVDPAAAAALQQLEGGQPGGAQAGSGGAPSGDGAAQPKLTLTLEPNFEVGEFGEPGDYRAWFVPTAPGGYTFRIVGRIGRQHVDQRFASSPTTFDEVADPAKAQFPIKEPTGSQLASRMDREAPRLSTALTASQLRAARADSAARQARLIAILGVAASLLGVVALSIATIRRR